MPCKNDAARACLMPAIQSHGARLLEGCRVIAVQVEGRRATGVSCLWRGRELNLRARTVVLAAGALQSPLILLRSDARAHTGAASSSLLVGAHLMRHLIDVYLVRPETGRNTTFDNRHKEIAFNDFYLNEGEKLGTVQSFGRLPPAPMLFGSLRDDVRASRFAWADRLLPLAWPLMRPVLHDMSNNWLALASITEDLPYGDNAVMLDPAGPTRARIRYSLRDESKRRVAHFRQLMAGVLKGRTWRRLSQTDNNTRIAHACGTCRFGNNPRTSVLDRDNRAHGMDNLFVVDSSFFPSSGGTNPSLTIAANAIRVGQKIRDQWL